MKCTMLFTERRREDMQRIAGIASAVMTTGGAYELFAEKGSPLLLYAGLILIFIELNHEAARQNG